MKLRNRSSLLRPRWTKVWSDLWNDRRRTGLVVASIAVGVFAVGLIITAYTVLAQDFNRGFEATNPPNIEIRTDPFLNDLVEVVGHVPGVRQVEGRLMLSIRARKGAESWRDLQLVGIPDVTEVNLLTPLAGALTLGKDEALVTKDLIHDTGFGAGDAIEIELPDGSSHHLKVVGLVSDQSTSKPSLGSTNNLYINVTTMRSLGLGASFSHLYITVNGTGDDMTAIEHTAAAVTEKLEDGGREVYRMDQQLSTQHPMVDTVLAMLGMLMALGVLVAVLGGSLIFNTLTALLKEQRRQIGVMKLVGASSRQIMGMYFTLITSYGIIALIVAAPLGAVLGYAFAWGIAALLGAVIGGFRIIPVAIAAQTLMAILLPLGAGFLPINGGAKTSVKQAISENLLRARAASNRMLSFNRLRLMWIT